MCKQMMYIRHMSLVTLPPTNTHFSPLSRVCVCLYAAYKCPYRFIRHVDNYLNSAFFFASFFFFFFHL